MRVPVYIPAPTGLHRTAACCTPSGNHGTYQPQIMYTPVQHQGQTGTCPVPWLYGRLFLHLLLHIYQIFSIFSGGLWACLQLLVCIQAVVSMGFHFQTGILTCTPKPAIMLSPSPSKLIVLPCMLLLLSSCYTYKVATQAQAGAEVSKPITAHSFFWGLLQKPASISTPVCDSLGVNGLAEVTMKTNFGYSLLTVATLGIWCPMRVQWKCGKPCKKTGTL